MSRATASASAYIALGSNLGDRTDNIHSALKLMASPGLHVIKTSTLIENPAVGGPPGSPDFLNAVAEIETTLDPHALLDRLLHTESRLGRIRTGKWEPRVIDVDIVLYDGRIINSPRLTIPHPLMHERRFVLGPLAEIAPNVMHPILKQTAVELLRQSEDPPQMNPEKRR